MPLYFLSLLSDMSSWPACRSTITQTAVDCVMYWRLYQHIWQLHHLNHSGWWSFYGVEAFKMHIRSHSDTHTHIAYACKFHSLNLIFYLPLNFFCHPKIWVRVSRVPSREMISFHKLEFLKFVFVWIWKCVIASLLYHQSAHLSVVCYLKLVYSLLPWTDTHTPPIYYWTKGSRLRSALQGGIHPSIPE